MTLKSKLRIIQGQWKRNHWIDHTRLLVEIFDVEYYRDLETWVRGHSRSLKVAPYESKGVVSYSPLIVIMAVSLAISEIFSAKEWSELEISVWGCSRSLKMGGWIDNYDFLSRVSILTRDIDIANLSVCPSVCLSVTFRYQMKTA